VKISIVIPFFNLRSYVETTLDSVRASAEGYAGAFECICVDDGSTDGTREALNEWAARDTRVRVVHKANGGEGSARNAGLEVATGDWLLYLDGDDVLLPGALAAAEQLVATYPEAEIVSLRFAPFVDGEAAPSARMGPVVCHTITRELTNEILRDVGVFPTLFRRDTFGDLRFTSLPLGADRLYVAETLARAHTLVLSQTVVHGYRMRAGSAMNSKWTPAKVDALSAYSAGSLAILGSCGKRIPSHAFVRFLCGVLLAEAPKNLVDLGENRMVCWAHWIESVRTVNMHLMPCSYRIARACILGLSWSPCLTLWIACLFRRLGVTKERRS